MTEQGRKMKCPRCDRELASENACVCGWRSEEFADLTHSEKRHIESFIAEEQHLIDFFEREGE